MGGLLYWRARRTDLADSKAIYDCYMCACFPLTKSRRQRRIAITLVEHGCKHDLETARSQVRVATILRRIPAITPIPLNCKTLVSFSQ